jgi:DNA polymerase elongation subunit (family B)
VDLFYLLDAFSENNIIKLVFYNTSTEYLHEIEIDNYKPYFFIKYQHDFKYKRAIEDVKVSTIEKKDLFTGKVKKLTRITVKQPSLLQKISNNFQIKWENNIPYVLSYIYDHNLVFGAPYFIKEKRLKTAYKIDDSLKLRFQKKFITIKETDKEKYELLEQLFILCSQPIPNITLEKLGIKKDVDYKGLYLSFLLSRISNLPLSTTITNNQVSTWIRSIFYNYLRKKNILIPNSREIRRKETLRGISGALTFKPKTGTYFNTVVVDFESLYPSIIDVYNLSYETFDCGHPECIRNKIKETKHQICLKRRGIYSILIGALKDLRIHWFKPLSKDTSINKDERLLADAASTLLKLILVSSYGVTVRIHGLAQPTLAETITTYGRHVLKESWKLAEEIGLNPLYGDTDSLFLDNPSDKEIQDLIRKVKENLHLDLAVDKVYSVCVLPRAMKSYFGILKDGTPDVKGLTAIKSNSPHFIHKVFMLCAKELVNVKNWKEFEDAKENIRRVVKRAVANLKSGKVPLKDLTYTIKLHFDPNVRFNEEETIHQPYQCAIQLINMGKNVKKGSSVSFLKVKPFGYAGKKFTVKPFESVRNFSEINMEDYISNLKTALSQTFKPMNISFLDNQETTLADFL